MNKLLRYLNGRFCSAIALFFLLASGPVFAQNINTIAGNGTTAVTDGVAATSSGMDPYQVAVDASGNMYIADYANARVRKVSTSGIITTFAGTGSSTYGGSGGAASSTGIGGPLGLAIDASGNVYMVGYSQGQVYKVNTSGIISLFAGAGTSGYSGDGGQATAAQLTLPYGICFDPAGNAYIADRGNNVIRKVNTSGIISTFAGIQGSSGSTGDGGAATLATMIAPTCVASDVAGNIYFTDGLGNNVRKINTAGIISLVAGNGSSGFSGDGGAATSASITQPSGLSVDASNAIYITDYGDFRVRRIDPVTGIINSIAGSGPATSGSFTGDGGAATAATLSVTTGVTVDNLGNIYIADDGNGRIRKISGTCSGAPYAGITTTNVGNGCSTTSISLGLTGEATGTGISYLWQSSTDSITWSNISGATSTTYTTTQSAKHYYRCAVSCATGGTGFSVPVLIGYTTACYCTSGWTSSDDTTSGYQVYQFHTTGAFGTSIIDNHHTTGTLSTPHYYTDETGSMSVTYSEGGTYYVNLLTSSGGSSPLLGNTIWIDFNNDGVFSTSETVGYRTMYAGSGGSTTDTITIPSTANPGIHRMRFVQIYNSAYHYPPTYPMDACTPSYYYGETRDYTVNIGDGAPSFVNGTSQNASLCVVGTTDTVDNLLAISDGNSGQTETWTVITGPTHGSLGGFPYAATSTGGTVTPNGLWYIPTAGYSGLDSFKIQISDGITTASTTVHITDQYIGAISGSLTVAEGGTTTLSDTTAGGTWSLINVSTATVGSATGVAHGISADTTTIKYSGTAACGSYTRTATLTVTSIYCIPPYSAGCEYGDFINSVTTTGGSTNISNTSTGCNGHTNSYQYYPSQDVTAARGSSVTLTIVNGTPDAQYYGVWVDWNQNGSFEDAGEHVVNGTSTIASGVSTPYSISVPSGATAGTTRMRIRSSYTTSIASSCVSASFGETEDYNFTVCGAAPITGTTSICGVGNATYLHDTTSGGTWSTASSSVATVNSAGMVTAAGVGTTTISYQVTSSCGTSTVTASVTVYASSIHATLGGASTVCVGGSTTLTTTGIEGEWSTSAAGVASVQLITGQVFGISAGTATITYKSYDGCDTSISTWPVTVTAGPSVSSISGATTVCVGQTTTLTDVTTSGTWSSSNASLATVNTTGGVTGMAAGSVTITYTVSNSCGSGSAYYNMTVNGPPSAGSISGSTTLCPAAQTTLTDAAGGGTWSSNTTSVATIGATNGIVTGVGTGSATISYSVSGTCGTSFTTAIMVVLAGPATPAAITGASSVCQGATTTLADGTSSGTWSCSPSSFATINSSGMVTGVSAGTATVSYTVSNSCGSAGVSHTITVNGPANAGTISGVTSFCQGTQSTLTDGASGGTWTSSNTTVATVNSSGVVTGVSGGSTVISYSVSGACGSAVATSNVTINPLPAVGAITGTSTVCPSGTTTLGNTTSGGSWTSSNNSIATVNASGMVTGVTSGAVIISYSVTNSCGTTIVTTGFTVSASPSAGSISGSSSVCPGANITLTDGVTGGTWSSGNVGLATINASGMILGISSGSVTISYTVSSSCGVAIATYPVTVSPLPNAGAISGTPTVCQGLSVTLTDAVSGGTWSSSNSTIASVNATGSVTGISGGTTLISYTVSNVCGNASTSVSFTVTPTPAAGSITGTLTVCPGFTTTLSDAVSGGTWSSSNSAIASVVSSGIVTGGSVGTATITYTVTNSCGTASTTASVTVSSAPNAGIITGAGAFCQGSTLTLHDAVSGGTWSSSNSTIASVNGSGAVTGVSGGIATITYTVSGACGSAVTTAGVTVNPLAIAGTITGTTTVCQGSSTTLSDGSSGGVWSTSNAAVASINASGMVTGVSGGTATITYSVTNGCGTATTTTSVTVTSSPSAGSITGTTTFCQGTSSTLSDGVSGGTWSSANGSIASVNASGVVTGISAGTTSISYTVVTSCGTAATGISVTINPLPNAGSVSGASSICQGAATTLSDGTSGGSWSSSNSVVASVNATGVVTGVTGGEVPFLREFGKLKGPEGTGVLATACICL